MNSSKKNQRKPLRIKENSKKQQKTTAVKPSLKWDEEIASSGDEGSQNGSEEAGDDESDEEEETAEQKRKRLAKEYLSHVQTGYDSEASDDSADGGDLDSNVVSDRLRRDRLDAQGKYFRNLSKGVSELNVEKDIEKRSMSGHQSSVTCVALSADDSSIYSGSKDNSVIHWDTETGKKKTILRPKWTRATHGDHQASEGEVLCIANTSDGRYIVSSGRDKAVRIYDSRMKYAEIKCLTGHRDTVTCLSFRRDSYSLFSGSMDRCLKHWDLNEMGYLETMFGHQDGVNAMDCWTQERPISASSDRTLRVWKVSDESHLVLRGHKGTIDCVKMMTEDTYLSGGQDGTLNLWKDTQKKPVAYAHAAHGEEIKGSPRWITSVASVKMSDLAASGSYDGYVRLWNVNASENRTLTPHLVLPCDGFVNSLAMSTSLVVAGTGQEHRLGRWWRTKGNINKIVVWRLPEEN